MVLLKMHGLIAAGAAVVTLGAGGTAAALTMGGPIDSAGVIHGCYTPQGNKGSYTLTLQNAGTSCPRGSTAISWNQKGATGATGARGPAGPAGAGLTFTTASGTTGPTVSTGTYDFDLTIEPENLTSAAVDFTCFVNEAIPSLGTNPLFGDTYQLPAGSAAQFTLSGITPVQAGGTLSVTCDTAAGPLVPLEQVAWYVAPVQTSG